MLAGGGVLLVASGKFNLISGINTGSFIPSFIKCYPEACWALKMTGKKTPGKPGVFLLSVVAT
jgi:hypothetical protein